MSSKRHFNPDETYASGQPHDDVRVQDQWGADGGRARRARQPGGAAHVPALDVTGGRNVSGEPSKNTISRAVHSAPFNAVSPQHVEARRPTLSSSGEAGRAVVVDPGLALREASTSRAPTSADRLDARRQRAGDMADSVPPGADAGCPCPTCDSGGVAGQLGPDASRETLAYLTGADQDPEAHHDA